MHLIFRFKPPFRAKMSNILYSVFLIYYIWNVGDGVRLEIYILIFMGLWCIALLILRTHRDQLPTYFILIILFFNL